MSTLPDAVATILSDEADGLRAEELCTRLQDQQLAFAFVTPDAVARVLARHPDRFICDGAGRWILYAAAVRGSMEQALEERPHPERTARSESVSCRGYVIFDLEATSNDPAHAEVIQIAAIRVDADLSVVRDTFIHSYVRPSHPIPPEVTRLTGITDDKVRDAPVPAEVLADFCAFA